MKFNRDLLNRRWAAMVLAGCATVLFYLIVSRIHLLLRGMQMVGVFVWPVFLGVIIAYVLDPLVGLFQRTVFRKVRTERISRYLGIFLAFFVVILGIVILMIALVPQIVTSVRTFINNFGMYSRQLRGLIDSLSDTAAQHDFDLSGITQAIDNGLDRIANSIPSALRGLLETSIGFGRSFFTAVISSILAIYFLAEKKTIKTALRRLFRALLSRRHYESVHTFTRTCNVIMSRYIAADLLDGIIVGIATWVFMTVTRMSFSVLLSVLIAVTNLAPTFGPIVGAIIGALFLVFVNPLHALIFLIFAIVLQMIDGYVIKPKLFGDQLGVSGALILVAIIVGGRMFGVVGVLLGIPCAAILDHAYKTIVIPRLEARREQLEAAEDAAVSAAAGTPDSGAGDGAGIHDDDDNGEEP